MSSATNEVRPGLVVHADWSLKPAKRWMARAILRDGQYRAHASEKVGDALKLVDRMRAEAGEDAVVVLGFDFPIGLPAVYAEQAGVHDFVGLLPKLGRGEWSRFYEPAERPEEITLHRPFYPRRPGGAKKRHLLDALGSAHADELLRRCDRGYPGRRAASAIFWTMGPQQVGKAAICGWREVLVPALANGADRVKVWPFDGQLQSLLEPGRAVICETYPAEMYRHTGVGFSSGESKTSRESRKRKAGALIAWAEAASVELHPDLRAEIDDGFGSAKDGEDRFDAVVGLLGMVNVILGHRSPGEPNDERIRKVEGWMLGQNPDMGTAAPVNART